MATIAYIGSRTPRMPVSGGNLNGQNMPTNTQAKAVSNFNTRQPDTFTQKNVVVSKR